jgi:hypothetical protein
VLCVAGAAKLRSPAPAVRALRVAGVNVRPVAVRAFAAAELALGLWAVTDPGPIQAGALAATYVVFAGLALLLAKRSASCGCFGESEAPASVAQAILSSAFAATSLAALLSTPHGASWVLGRPASTAAVLAIGLAGSAKAIVLAYTELPSAWTSWSAR